MKKPTHSFLRCLFKDEQGASALEYAMLGALVAAVIVLAVTALGIQTRTLFCTVITSLGGSC